MKKIKNKKVLCCDDDDGILELLSILLADLKIEAITIRDSSNIFEIIKEECPDLIFLDLWMPKKSGELLCKEIKSNSNTKNIPVILLSAHKDVREKNLDLNADGYIFKPFDIKEIEEIIKKFI